MFYITPSKASLYHEACVGVQDANLSDVLMDRSVMNDANLKNAILQRTVFTRSDLTGANVEGADFTNALLDKTQQMVGCNLTVSDGSCVLGISTPCAHQFGDSAVLCSH